MNFARTALSVLLLGAVEITASAQGLTREQVKAELMEAIRTGDIPAGGDSSLKRNELFPQAYPRAARAPQPTAAQGADTARPAVGGAGLAATGELGASGPDYSQRQGAVAR
jgi:hypothetical protein